MAREVAGGRASVSAMLAPNSDPHDYEPKPSDAEAMAGADLILRSGGDLDEWIEELIESSGTDAPELVLIDSVRTLGTREVDPHWWQDPHNALLAVEDIRNGLAEADPGGEADYQRNADRYSREIERLGDQIEQCVGTIPAAQRKLVTSHDALEYFANRFGFEVVGSAFPALTTTAQPSAGETAELVGLIRRLGVRAVFPESGLDGGLERAIADDAGAIVGGQLYADTLDEEGLPGGTYLGALAANAATIVSGLGGDMPSCELDLAR